MGWTEVLDERAALLTRRVTKAQQRRRAAVDQDGAFEAAAVRGQSFDAFNLLLHRSRAVRDGDPPAADNAPQPRARRLADLDRFGQRAHIAVRFKNGARQRMARI